MAKPDLLAFLERAATDYEFREQLRVEPESAFEGYALGPDERNALRARDRRVLVLLQATLQTEAGFPAVPVASLVEPGTGAAAATAASDAGLAATVELLLQLTPLPARDAQGQLSLSHMAALHSRPGPGRPMPPPPADAPEGAAPPVYFTLNVDAFAARAADGQIRLSYLPRVSGLIGQGESDEENDSRPAEHAGNPETVTDLAAIAARVRRARPAERYACLAELAGAIEQAGEPW